LSGKGKLRDQQTRIDVDKCEEEAPLRRKATSRMEEGETERESTENQSNRKTRQGEKRRERGREKENTKGKDNTS
jgi:hypothetical protein